MGTKTLRATVFGPADGDEYVGSECFTPTPRLRWRVPPYTTMNSPVLEQAWRGDRGTVKWEPVPTVVVEADEAK